MANNYTYFQRTANTDPNSAADINQVNNSLSAIVATSGTTAPPEGATLTELKTAVDNISGGGSGLLSVENTSRVQKADIDYPLSNNNGLSVSFAGNGIISASLSTAYSYNSTHIDLTFSNDVPNLSTQLYIYSTASGKPIEPINITGTYGTGGNYVIDTISTSFAKGDFVKDTSLIKSGNKISFDSSITGGDQELTGYNVESIYLPTNFTDRTIEWSHRWNEESYAVDSFISSTAISLSSTIDISSMWATGDYIWMHQSIWNGKTYNTRYDSTLSANAKRLTYSGGGSYNSTTDLYYLPHDESNTHTLTDGWRVVRESSEYGYSLSQTGSLIYPTPSSMLPKNTSLREWFADYFNVGDQTLSAGSYNNWDYESSDGGSINEISSNELRQNGDAGLDVLLGRDLEGYSQGDPIEITYKLTKSGTSIKQAIMIADSGSDRFGLIANSIGFQFSDTQLTFTEGTTIGTPISITSITSGTWNVKVQFTRTYAKAKIWSVSAPEPLKWNLEVTPSATNEWNIITDRLITTTYDGSANAGHLINNFFVKPIGFGYITKGSVSNITTNFLKTETKMTRNATAYQPSTFQRDTVII
jgi:hypothetical protein